MDWVVSYRNSTSNHNTGGSKKRGCALYLIEILHQTTTAELGKRSPCCCILSKFYIKPQQIFKIVSRNRGCILSKFYIKPQPAVATNIRSQRCILSKFYIKPQRGTCGLAANVVVSYRNSTSNHNLNNVYINTLTLYLIEILHQTTTILRSVRETFCCILSKFYIKPQQGTPDPNNPNVVSYRNSTSNHNYSPAVRLAYFVVSYRNSTSNHNEKVFRLVVADVVSYRNSTSNHNYCTATLKPR